MFLRTTGAKVTVGLLMLAAMLLALTLTLQPVQSADETAPTLFTDVDTQGMDLPAVDSAEVIGTKYVTVNPQLLANDGFTLNISDSFVVEVARERYQGSAENAYFYGTAPAYDSSSITLHNRKGVMNGVITVNGRFFSLRHVEGDIHALHALQQTHREGGDDSVPVDSLPVGEIAPSPSRLLDTGDPVIDIVVLWTPAARTALAASAKPYTDMEEWINYGIDDLNRAYDRSGINQRVRLVYLQEVNYTEPIASTTVTTFNDLVANAGAFSVVPALEATYKADLVALLHDAGDSCGRGNTPSSVGGFNTGANHTVTAWHCVWPNYSFHHELGHNMGGQHDWFVNNSTSLGTYVHGHVDEPNAFRTIMGYSDECSAVGGSCPRINHFSNPAVNYLGNPTGIAAGTNSTCATGVAPADCDADNALNFNNTGSLVSAYRALVYDIGIGDPVQNSGLDFAEWTDANGNEICADDAAGANDVAGADDVTKACVSGNQVDSVYFLQGTDDISNVGDTSTACTLIDTNLNGFFDYSVCTTQEDNAGTNAVQATKLFSCTDTSDTVCAGAAAVKTYDGTHPTSAAYYSDGAYWFDTDEAGPFDVTDALLEIQVPYSDIGVTNADVLCVSFASYTDESALATNLDTIFTDHDERRIRYELGDGAGSITTECPVPAKLEIGKEVDPMGSVAAGDTLTYTVLVTNTGEVTAPATVTDVFSSDLTNVSCSAEIVTYGYSNTVQQLGVFPLDVSMCMDAQGATSTLFDETGIPATTTSPLTCPFSVPNNAQVSTYDIEMTWNPEPCTPNCFSFDVDRFDVTAPSGTSDSTTFFLGSGTTGNYTHAETGNAGLVGEPAPGAWSASIYDKSLTNNGHVLVSGDVTVFGSLLVETAVPETVQDLETGATHVVGIGETLRYTCSAEVATTVCGSASTTIDNTATASAPEDPIALRTSNTVSNAIDTTACAALDIEKSVEPTTNVLPTDVVTYTIAITNTGASLAASTTITDTFPAGFNSDGCTVSVTGGATGYSNVGAGTDLSQTGAIPAGATVTYECTGMFDLMTVYGDSAAETGCFAMPVNSGSPLIAAVNNNASVVSPSVSLTALNSAASSTTQCPTQTAVAMSNIAVPTSTPSTVALLVGVALLLLLPLTMWVRRRDRR